MKRYKGSYLSYFLMYMFYYLSMALFSGLISVYLMEKGYKATEVSFVISCSLVVSMIMQPIIGALNDRFDQKKVNGSLLLVSIFFSLLFPLFHHIYLIALVYSIVVGILNGTNPVIERMATLSRHRYGAIRIWGTIGYATGSQLSGLIYQYLSPESMYRFFGIGMILCVIGILGTQNVRSEVKKVKDKIPLKEVLFNKNMIIYMIIACLFYGMTNIHSTYLPAMFQHSGLTTTSTTTILFVGTMFELPVILLSKYYMDQLTIKKLLLVVFTLEIIQFFTLSMIPILWIQMIVVILTKSVCTMAFIMINMKAIATLVDEYHQMSALALVATMKSLFTIFFQNIGAYLLDHTSFHQFYLSLTLIAVIGFVIILVYPFPNNSSLKMYS